MGAKIIKNIYEMLMCFLMNTLIYSLNNVYVEGSCIFSLKEQVSGQPAPKSVARTVGFDLCSDLITSFAKNESVPCKIGGSRV